MSEPEPNFSRINRKRGRNRSNKILNVLTGIVILLIIIVAIPILTNNKNEDADQVIEKKPLTKEEMVGSGGSETAGQDIEQVELPKETEDEEVHTDSAAEESSDVLKYVASDDSNIVESIIDSSWTPIGTSQTGEHVSLYDGKSADWLEKKQALAYAVGMSEDDLIFNKIKNGGTAQKSIGIISSRDGTKKYRVFLEWVDGQGWKPVQMDVLRSLDFDY